MEIQSAIIFGSRAMGTSRNGSDVDIAIKGDRITEDLILEISSELNEKIQIPYRVDIVAPDLTDNEDLAENIKRVGK